jgi:hypothetical protein
MAASLSSNNGEAQIVVELRAPAACADDSGYESTLHLCGRHWDGEHSFPFTTSIEGLWLRATDLQALHEHISRWLRRPLDCLIADDLNGAFQLATLPGQCIHVRFGPRPDTISNLNPVVTLTFSAGAYQGEFHFVTDQSCLAVFSQDLSVEFAGSPPREDNPRPNEC